MLTIQRKFYIPNNAALFVSGDVDPEELLHLLAIDFDVHRKLLLDTGFEAIRLIWLRHAAKLGDVITARTMRDEITGTFEDVDGDGNLILQTARCREAITAADVFFKEG